LLYANYMTVTMISIYMIKLGVFYSERNVLFCVSRSIGSSLKNLAAAHSSAMVDLLMCGAKRILSTSMENISSINMVDKKKVKTDV
jgi:hypothetical protein